MPTYSTWADKKNQLIRKALNGSAFIADYSAAALTAITATGGALVTLPTGYEDAGFMTTDGVTFSEAITTSDTSSWGSVEPTRSDIKSEITTAKLVLQETKALTIGLYTGADMTAVTAAASGEVAIEKPLTPSARYYRVLSLAVDNNNDGEIYVGRYLPRCKVTDKDDQSHSESDDGILWGVTLTAFQDATLGYSEKFFFGGPGWLAMQADAGFGA